MTIEHANLAHRERAGIIGDALDRCLSVPQDTYVTDDLPLLLTRLARIPAVPEPTQIVALPLPPTAG